MLARHIKLLHALARRGKKLIFGRFVASNQYEMVLLVM